MIINMSLTSSSLYAVRRRICSLPLDMSSSQATAIRSACVFHHASAITPPQRETSLPSSTRSLLQANSDQNKQPSIEHNFKPLAWKDVKIIIENNELHLLDRAPSDTIKYHKWGDETRAKYGSIMNYLIAHRFPKAWGTALPFTPKSKVPFENPSDYRVLLNDWPYTFEPGIVHLVVWTRSPIATDSERGDMLPQSRQLISKFVKKFFIDKLGTEGPDKVLWFKNWTSLQSVPALHHVHVLVRDVEPEIVAEWTRAKDWHQ